MSKTILFITTHNLATNPRLVKEIDLAIRNDYSVIVICFEFNNWSFKINNEIKEKYSKVNFVTISAGKKPFVPWFGSMFKEKMYRLISYLFDLPTSMNAQAVSRRSDLLIRALNEIESADLVIGHNPGALNATVIAAKKFNCNCGFDIEDYHPGEGQNKHLQNLVLKIMNELLPKLNYLSFASESILQEINSKITFGQNQILFPVLNLFNANEFQIPKDNNGDKMKLVWFSQHIDFNRGLEKIVPIIYKYHNLIELHLYGNLSSDFEEKIIKNKYGIVIHPSISQIELHHELANCDIGLAIEPGKDLNNNLAVSNKIIAYFQSGIYILATDTQAQNNFLTLHHNHGVLTDKSFSNFENILLKLVSEILSIRKNKLKRFENAQHQNWDTESIILKNTWKHLTQ